MNISFQTFTDVTLMVKVINCGWFVFRYCWHGTSVRLSLISSSLKLCLNMTATRPAPSQQKSVPSVFIVFDTNQTFASCNIPYETDE